MFNRRINHLGIHYFDQSLKYKYFTQQFSRKMSVKVGVRVRPFNKRQQQLGSTCCVDMSGNTTYVREPGSHSPKTFVFDYSFWSHDKFTIDQNGVYHAVDDKYADQKRVYDLIGTDILNNAWQGYNCCLFAYGQTGSGKSYSMLGYGANRGIIPMVCDNIFDKIKKDKDQSHSYEVKVSMMEIYNQNLRDLLGVQKKQNNQLKICESKQLGVYVEGLQKFPVYSYQEIDAKIQEGSKNRSIAATLMNESSSRSHTIVSITFLQKIKLSSNQASVKYSTIYLVDLAGSQSVGKTGVNSTDRLREAAKINQSLSTLGRVIQILAENSGKTDKAFVPYRDSKLTFILRNALGGNSRTIMICAISPADDNYQETVSTLRYANRAKKIQNKATVNQSDVDKLIRQLRTQNQMLKQMLMEAKNNKTGINMEMVSNVQQMNRNMAQFGLVPEEQLLLDDDKSNANKDDKDGSFSENSISILDYNEKIDEKQAYITNLSQDQLLSGRLKYSCNKVLTIGNKQGVPRPDVVLTALGILPLHCRIKNEEQKIFIEICDEAASQFTFVNGENVVKEHKVELMNFDRLIFGSGCVFLVRIPEGPIRKILKDKQLKQVNPQDIDHTYAISEMHQKHVTGGLNDKNSKVSQAEQQQIRKKVLEQIQSSYDKMKQQNQQQLKNRLKDQEKEYQQKIKEIQKIRSEQAKRLKEQLQRQSSEASKLQKDKQKIQQEIVHFKELQKKLQQSNIDKEALKQARTALQEKMKTINDLQSSLLTIESKQLEMKEQMQKKQIIIQKQLEVKMVMCNNQNILNQYKLELSKKMKNTEELKNLLVKKEKVQLQKQIIELIPMVEKFNLIAKEMGKNIQCGMSIDYNYISEGQILEILKNNSIKNKIKISIHIYNREEKRSYFWSIDVFKNRYELAISMFEVFIRNQKDPQLKNKETDPYWDPPAAKMIGIAFLSLQTIFYKLSFEGDISIVKKGHKIGKVYMKIYPTDAKKTQDLSLKTLEGITIYNPRDFIQKTIYFSIQISELKLEKQHLYNTVQLQYTLIQSSYKNLNIQTQPMPPGSFKYQGFHVLADISQSVIVQYLDHPLSIKILADHLQDQEDNLTSRDDESEGGSAKGSFIQNKSLIEIKQEHSDSPVKNLSTIQAPTSGIIVSNFEVMQKIELQFSKQKLKQQKKQKQKQISNSESKKSKSLKDDCTIF